MMTRLSFFVFCLIMVRPSWAEQPGLSRAAPADGTAIRQGDWFLVPYTQTIPGTQVRFEMVPVPGGRFTLGSPADESGREDHEGPQLEIELPPFWIGKYEVTWSEYWKFMELDGEFTRFAQLRNMLVDAARPQLADQIRTATASLPELRTYLATEPTFADAVTAPTALYDPSTTYESGEDPRQPAVTMTPYAARQYTKWLSAITAIDYRLPTEVEWEYAARAGSRTAYSFGAAPDALAAYAWYVDNSDDRTHRVGEKKPNGWGLYDVHGNVAEWVLDGYSESGYELLAEQVAAREAGGDRTPRSVVVWATEPDPRIARGGFWDSDGEDLRSAARMLSSDEEWKSSDPNLPRSPWWFTEYPAGGVGFRIVRPWSAMRDKERQHAWEIDARDIRLDVTDRLNEGRGKLGTVNQNLPAALEQSDAEVIRQLLGEE